MGLGREGPIIIIARRSTRGNREGKEEGLPSRTQVRRRGGRPKIMCCGWLRGTTGGTGKATLSWAGPGTRGFFKNAHAHVDSNTLGITLPVSLVSCALGPFISNGLAGKII